MFIEVQEALHGPDHLARALVKQPAPGRETGRELALANGGEELQTTTGQAPGCDAAQGLPSRTAEEYVMHTPRGGHRDQFAETSPDHLLHDPQARDIWEADAATHTEASEEQEERLERLAQHLAQIETADQPSVQFMVRVDQLRPEYRDMYGLWLASDPVGRADTSLKLFAMESLLRSAEKHVSMSSS